MSALAGDQAPPGAARELLGRRPRAQRPAAGAGHRKQDRRLPAALLAAALAHTPEAQQVLDGARMRMARKPTRAGARAAAQLPQGPPPPRRPPSPRPRWADKGEGENGNVQAAGEPQGQGEEQEQEQPSVGRPLRAAPAPPSAGGAPRPRRRASVRGRSPQAARPESSIPAAVPSPSSQRTALPGSASRSRQRGQDLRASAGQAELEAAHQLLQHPLRRGVDPAPPAPATWPARQAPRGNCRRVHVQPDPQHRPPLLRAAPRPGCRPACGRPTHTSLGHFTWHSTGDTASRPRTPPQPPRSGSSSGLAEVAQHQRHQHGGPGRRGPLTTLPPASCALLVRRHERPVRRPQARQLLRALVGGVGRAVVHARQAGHRGRSRTSVSEARPSVSAASPRLIGHRERSVGVLVDDQLAGRHVGEGGGVGGRVGAGRPPPPPPCSPA